MPLVSDVERSFLLDPMALYGDVGNAEPGIFLDLNGIQFRRITQLVNGAERVSQSSINRLFPCSSKASSRAGSSHPDEVPARLSDHLVENCSRDLVYKHPVLAKRLPKGIQMIRQDALLTQEDGMESHP